MLMSPLLKLLLLSANTGKMPPAQRETKVLERQVVSCLCLATSRQQFEQSNMSGLDYNYKLSTVAYQFNVSRCTYTKQLWKYIFLIERHSMLCGVTRRFHKTRFADFSLRENSYIFYICLGAISVKYNFVLRNVYFFTLSEQIDKLVQYLCKFYHISGSQTIWL